MSWTKFFKAAGKAVAAVQKQQAQAKPRKIPVMTMEMIQSNGGPITTAQAIKLFKDFSLQTGYLDKSELTEHAGYFAEEMKEHLEFLEQDAKGDLEQLRESLKDLKALRKGETDKETRESLDEEIEQAKEDLARELAFVQPAVKNLADFKADKRQYLLNYTNGQTQGR